MHAWCCRLVAATGAVEDSGGALFYLYLVREKGQLNRSFWETRSLDICFRAPVAVDEGVAFVWYLSFGRSTRGGGGS